MKPHHHPSLVIAVVASCLSGLPSTALTTARAEPVHLYVATTGDDTWSGTLQEPNPVKTDGPFATLSRARDAIRDLKKAGPLRQAVTITVQEGTYALAEAFRLGSLDSGGPSAVITYTAAPRGQVRICGGRSVPPEAFSAANDSQVLANLDAGTRGHVVQTDLKALGITQLGEFPIRYRGAPLVPELFFNGRRMTLARWPNDGWTTIAKIIESGSNPRIGDSSGRPGTFEYQGDRPNRWNVESGIWLHGYWCFDWYDEAIRVQSIDRQQHRITLVEPHLYSLKQGNPSPRRYCAINLLEELDSPGEYYIDRRSGRLYFWPPEAISGARVVLSTLSTPIVSLDGCENVVFRGFILEAGLADGFEVNGGSGVRIQACKVRNVRQMGIRVTGGTGHRIEACDIYDTGTGGLLLEGGDRKTLTAAGHEAVNNHIWGFSRHQFTSSYGIILGGVGNRAAHNLVHDAPHQAIGIQGNDHVFEYNVVHHVCTETDDCGALYKGRNPSCRGNVIRYNYWHHIGSPMGHGNAAVYFDDGDGGDTVFGNVFFRCGDPGKGSFGTVFSHGGHDNVAENNIFIECRRALGSAPWNDKRWRDYIAADLWQTRLLKEVDITKPPYTTRYPELVGFMDPQPGQPRVNRAVRNLFVDCEMTTSGNWKWELAENWGTDQDPGFVDAAHGDFRLRPDAAVFDRLPGFQPIPVDKIGLFVDELRPEIAAKACGDE